MRKKDKLTPELLAETINKFKLLCEYDFYQEKKTAPEHKELILGDEIDEAEEAPSDLKPDEAAADIAKDLNIDAEPDAQEEIPEPAPEPIEPPQEEASDEVEIDVTSLVKGSEEATKSAENASHNTELLLHKLSNLEARVASMDKVSAKIDALEKEVIKRNPTPVEKLEMSSLSSFPYTQKLSDYWADKEGIYDVMNTDKKKEYILTKDDVESDYSDGRIKQSFNVTKNDFEEEDI